MSLDGSREQGRNDDIDLYRVASGNLDSSPNERIACSVERFSVMK